MHAVLYVQAWKEGRKGGSEGGSEGGTERKIYICLEQKNKANPNKCDILGRLWKILVNKAEEEIKRPCKTLLELKVNLVTHTQTNTNTVDTIKNQENNKKKGRTKKKSRE